MTELVVTETQPTPAPPPRTGARHRADPSVSSSTATTRAERRRAESSSTSSWRLSAAVALNLCLVAVWFLAYVFGISALQEARDQRVLYNDFRGTLAAGIAPVGGVIAPGTPVALISAPAAGIDDLVVVEGTASGDLLSGPGHLRNTPLPGQAGASVLMGRGAAAGAPFEGITSLSPGDPIQVTNGQGEFTYEVLDVRRAGDPLPPTLAEGSSRLVLVTSEGGGWRKGLSTSGVVYVDADLKAGKVQPTPAGRPIAVPDAELPMQGDPGAWIPLLVWLQIGVYAAVGLWFFHRRLGRWRTWLIAAPIALAVAWGASAAALQLLPNLL